MGLFLATTAVLGIALLGLSVGVIFSDKKELQGSCGGPDANPDCCQTCPDKVACDDVNVPAIDVPSVQSKEHPLLAQAKSAGGPDGSSVATPH